jgi:SAM-dependent methyltransferase
MTVASSDQWNTGDAYETFMGRWSQGAAERFVRWLDPEPGLAWLDLGCGTGALTRAICALADPVSVTACDPSESFVAHLRGHVADPRVTAVVAGADALPGVRAAFDNVVSGLVLNFIPEPRRALEAMRERTRKGGIVAAYVWDYTDGMGFLRAFWDEAARLDPAARDLDEGVRFPLSRREPLVELFRASGLGEVRSEPIDVPTRFESFADYWRPFLGGTGPAPAYAVSLGADAREHLRAGLEQRLGTNRIDLVARAWAVCGNA